MMDRIARSVEADPVYSARIHFTETPAEATIADALSESAAQIVDILDARAMACYTSSGSTARRIARERAQVPTLAMTSSMKVARRLGLQWGVHAVHTRDVNNFEEMVGKAKRMVLRHHLARGQRPRPDHGRRAVQDSGVDQRHPCRADRRRRTGDLFERGVGGARGSPAHREPVIAFGSAVWLWPCLTSQSRSGQCSLGPMHFSSTGHESARSGLVQMGSSRLVDASSFCAAGRILTTPNAQKSNDFDGRSLTLVNER